MKNKKNIISIAANPDATKPTPGNAMEDEHIEKAPAETVFPFVSVRVSRVHSRSSGDWFWTWKYAPLLP
jgi:hypothetical protein